MKLRERRNAERQDPPREAGDGGGSNLEALSAAAERLRAAGDAAIDRVLSGNSAAWLMSNQQRGGQ